jgi:hypothetical protein
MINALFASEELMNCLRRWGASTLPDAKAELGFHIYTSRDLSVNVVLRAMFNTASASPLSAFRALEGAKRG